MNMDIVIGDVACRDQTDRRDMQACRAVGVGVTCRNAHHLLALKVDDFAVEFLRDRECCVDLSGKSGPPESVKKRRRSWRCITEIASRVATNRALGKLRRIVFTPKKWSP